jgi:predicted RecA/RadA family phage recombinase
MDEVFASKSEVIMVPAPVGGVKRGELIIIGKLCGVATAAAKQGDEVEIVVDGCFDLQKDGSAMPLGSPAYWEANKKKITTLAPGNIRIGVVVGAASHDAEIVRVRLDGFLV